MFATSVVVVLIIFYHHIIEIIGIAIVVLVTLILLDTKIHKEHPYLVRNNTSVKTVSSLLREHIFLSVFPLLRWRSFCTLLAYCTSPIYSIRPLVCVNQLPMAVLWRC